MNRPTPIEIACDADGNPLQLDEEGRLAASGAKGFILKVGDNGLKIGEAERPSPTTYSLSLRSVEDIPAPVLDRFRNYLQSMGLTGHDL